MNICEALNQYGTHADWFAWTLFFCLGIWKGWDLSNAAGRWAERKVKNDSVISKWFK